MQKRDMQSVWSIQLILIFHWWELHLHRRWSMRWQETEKKAILEGRIFELGNVFIPKDLPLTEYPDERETLCVGLFGEKESFYTLKRICRDGCRFTEYYIHIRGSREYIPSSVSDSRDFLWGRESRISWKSFLWVMDELDMRVPAYVMEIDLAALKKWYGKEQIFTPLPKYAEEKRDFRICGRQKHHLCTDWKMVSKKPTAPSLERKLMKMSENEKELKELGFELER